jgi:E3 ubiquitin-protein ligase RAD18
MIWRHKEYLNLYNANYDSQNPVSANVLIQRLQAIEHSHMNDKYNKSKRKAEDPEKHRVSRGYIVGSCFIY